LIKTIKYILSVISIALFTHPNLWQREYNKLKEKNRDKSDDFDDY